VLGEFGAKAIAAALEAAMDRRPAEATIKRVPSRLGLQDGVRLMRTVQAHFGGAVVAAWFS
jgi:hypothetical protein